MVGGGGRVVGVEYGVFGDWRGCCWRGLWLVMEVEVRVASMRLSLELVVRLVLVLGCGGG